MEADTPTSSTAKRKIDSRSRVGTLVVMGAVAALILGVVYLTNQPKAGATADGGVQQVELTGAAGQAPVVGQQAPDLTLVTADGTTMKLSDLRGHPVWLTFGASWCQPCRAENPDIQATFAKHQGTGLEVVQVFLSEDQAAVKEYADRVGLQYTLVPDPNTALASAYRTLGIPTHFFIDANGVLTSMKIGSLDQTSMDAALGGIGG
jgi:cytochrome c biogenesis protein CcmG/thiol:disulfide interchange protein DsbE